MRNHWLIKHSEKVDRDYFRDYFLSKEHKEHMVVKLFDEILETVWQEQQRHQRREMLKYIADSNCYTTAV